MCLDPWIHNDTPSKMNWTGRCKMLLWRMENKRICPASSRWGDSSLCRRIPAVNEEWMIDYLMNLMPWASMATNTNKKRGTQTLTVSWKNTRHSRSNLTHPQINTLNQIWLRFIPLQKVKQQLNAELWSRLESNHQFTGGRGTCKAALQTFLVRHTEQSQQTHRPPGFSNEWAAMKTREQQAHG